MADEKSFVTLNAIIKNKFNVSTGGQAKNIIFSGEVKVNNLTETRNKRKLVENDVVEYNSKTYTIKKEDIL